MDRNLTVAGQINTTLRRVKINVINGDFYHSEYVNLRIYIHGDNTTSKAFINIKAYVVNGLSKGSRRINVGLMPAM